MKNYITLIIAIVLCSSVFGNMAKPYTEGVVFSEIYGSENCSVINEKIKIDIIDEPSNSAYIAKYTIVYTISADVSQKLPLLFIGDGLLQVKQVRVNGKKISFNEIDFQNYTQYSFIERYQENDTEKFYIRYQKDNPIEVNLDDLFLFDADISEGTNKIVVEYAGVLGFNNFGFQKISELTYSLAPSKYWKSFGEIDVEMNVPENVRIVSHNLQDIDRNGSQYSGKIKNINNDIEIKISQKTSIIASILLFLQPIGLALISFVIMVFIHFKLIKKYNNNWIIWLGIFIVPILFYIVYFLSYNLIDFSLGNSGSKHGYVFLYILTFPFLLIIYGLVIYYIRKRGKLE